LKLFGCEGQDLNQNNMDQLLKHMTCDVI